MHAWASPARRLPIVLRPVHRETIPSYVERLAAANHVRAVSLMNYLGACSYAGFPSTSHEAKLNPAALERLVAVSGQPLASLQHALPALALVQRSDPTPIPTITWLATIRVPGPFAACARCVAGRGVDARPIVYLPGHWHLCARHGRWLRGHQQRDLAAAPEIVQAQRRLHRLVYRYGAQHVERAYGQAENVVLDWLHWGWHPLLHQRWDERMGRLGAVEQITNDAELVAATIYPEAVTLSGLLISPLWTATLPPHNRHTWEPFLAEARRRLDTRQPYFFSKRDPLVRLVRGERPHRWHLPKEDSPDGDPLLDHLGLPASLVAAERRAAPIPMLEKNGHSG